MKVTTAGSGFLAVCPCGWRFWRSDRKVAELDARRHTDMCARWREK